LLSFLPFRLCENSFYCANYIFALKTKTVFAFVVSLLYKWISVNLSKLNKRPKLDLGFFRFFLPI
jgi:hypothetical protein